MLESPIDNCMDCNIPRDVFTSLPNGEKVRKDDPRIIACGAIDELNSHLGLLLTDVPVSLVSEIQNIQTKLFAVGAAVAGVESPHGLPIDEDIQLLKSRIQDFMNKCGHLDSFVLPGGCHAAALAHLCRTVCRRAERDIVATGDYRVVPYMNRLSTYLFHLARYLNLFYGFKEFYIQ